MHQARREHHVEERQGELSEVKSGTGELQRRHVRLRPAGTPDRQGNSPGESVGEICHWRQQAMPRFDARNKAFLSHPKLRPGGLG